MPSEEDIAWIASLVGDPARSRILLALMDGRARTAKELAFFARIAAPTASGHLAKLLDAHLVAVEPQGRHRYYRLASERVGQMIESMAIVAGDALPFLRPGAPHPGAARDGAALLRPPRRPDGGGHRRRAPAARLRRVRGRRRRGHGGGPRLLRRSRARSRALRRDPARVLAGPASTGPSDATTSRAQSERPCASIAWRRAWLVPMRDSRALSITLEGQGALASHFGDRRGSASRPRPSGRRPESLAENAECRPRPEAACPPEGKGTQHDEYGEAALCGIHKASLRDRLLRWIPLPLRRCAAPAGDDTPFSARL
jgi:DNA-binding transcriptional ArsR family regulator